MSYETTVAWKQENKEYYLNHCRNYNKKKYKENPVFYKQSYKKWAQNNPHKVRAINKRKTVLYKKMVELLTLSNSPLMETYSFDDLFRDMTEIFDILFHVKQSEQELYEYSSVLGNFYYRRNFYVILIV